ncbi:MAG TPA: T9SS type A sorting domain-containing protein [Candidatus Saccharimonadaceae bacterium]|nr:T9SS type A sorting domain-containing protein [Candidatus Saccharimonadaceae bacterium]
MRPMMVGALLLAATLGVAGMASAAQGPRLDAVWARTTAGQPITLDGVLDEPAWAHADSVIIRYGVENGIPGSGWKEEGGKLAKDSTFAIVKFLVVGNQLYMGATIPDQSIGGSKDFNRFDGLLMSLKDHTVPDRPSPPSEYFYSWWYPVDTLIALNPGIEPCFRGKWGQDTCSTPRTAAQIAAWDARTKVHGISNSDAANDTGYTVEMRFDLGAQGYDVTRPGGDIVEFNLSIYDTDWMWPINLSKFSVNRTWIQSPWGNAAWYDELHLYSRSDVTINSGAAPLISPDIRIANAGGWPSPAIDGAMNEQVWNLAPPLHIRYGSDALRNSYGGVGPWRSGEFQPDVNASQAAIIDTADATVRMFFKADTLYLGFDVPDQVVQYVADVNRWDGFIVTLTDRVKRWSDHNLWTWRASFQVGPSGNLLAQDNLPYLRDTLGAVRCALTLKPGTTVDTLGQQADTGYQAEMAIDLTKLGYPPGLGDGWLWLGINLLDGDSFTPFTDSYATRTWWYRQYENDCCPADAYLDPNTFVTAVEGGVAAPTRFELLGNSPNPFRSATLIRYTLPRASEVTLEVFDLAGRRVASRPQGLQAAGQITTPFTSIGLHPGLYLYRIHVVDPTTRKETANLPGKMLLVR